jgi:type II secretory pathway component PulF
MPSAVNIGTPLDNKVPKVRVKLVVLVLRIISPNKGSDKIIPSHCAFLGPTVNLSQKEVNLFTKELATLLQAGLPLDRSLVVLMELIDPDSKIHDLIKKVLERVKGGVNLADALEAESSAFSRFYINMLRAGEAGGSVDIVLGH